MVGLVVWRLVSLEVGEVEIVTLRWFRVAGYRDGCKSMFSSDTFRGVD